MSTQPDPIESNNEPLEPTAETQPVQKTVVNHQGGSMDAVYAFGLFGAWIYYIGRAESVSEGLMGVLKGFVWPAILVHKLLVFFNEDTD